MKKLMMFAALFASLTLGACVDNEESASVTAVRNAYAEQLKSVAALNNAEAQATIIKANAEAQLAAAEAAYQAALTENQSIENDFLKAQYEAEIERIEAQLELDLINLEIQILQQQAAYYAQVQSNNDVIDGLYANFALAAQDVVAKQAALAKAEAALAKAESGLITDEEALAAAVAAAEAAYNDAKAATKSAEAALKAINSYEGQGSDDIKAAIKEVKIELSKQTLAYAQTHQDALLAGHDLTAITAEIAGSEYDKAVKSLIATGGIFDETDPYYPNWFGFIDSDGYFVPVIKDIKTAAIGNVEYYVYEGEDACVANFANTYYKSYYTIDADGLADYVAMESEGIAENNKDIADALEYVNEYKPVYDAAYAWALAYDNAVDKDDDLTLAEIYYNYDEILDEEDGLAVVAYEEALDAYYAVAGEPLDADADGKQDKDGDGNLKWAVDGELQLAEADHKAAQDAEATAKTTYDAAYTAYKANTSDITLKNAYELALQAYNDAKAVTAAAQNRINVVKQKVSAASADLKAAEAELAAAKRATAAAEKALDAALAAIPAKIDAFEVTYYKTMGENWGQSLDWDGTVDDTTAIDYVWDETYTDTDAVNVVYAVLVNTYNLFVQDTAPGTAAANAAELAEFLLDTEWILAAVEEYNEAVEDYVIANIDNLIAFAIYEDLTNELTTLSSLSGAFSDTDGDSNYIGNSVWTDAIKQAEAAVAAAKAAEAKAKAAYEAVLDGGLGAVEAAEFQVELAEVALAVAEAKLAELEAALEAVMAE